MGAGKKAILLSLFVLFILLAQALSVIPSGSSGVKSEGSVAGIGGSVTNFTGTTNVSGGHVTDASAVTNSSFSNAILIANRSSVPGKYLYLPNLNPHFQLENGVIKPAYSTSPAPMGIADNGIVNKSGVLTSYNYSTTSYEGIITVGNMSPLYVLNDAPQSLGVQLNAILKGVTVGSSSDFVYWTQNVMIYSARLHQILFVDNVWNFSSPGAGMNNSTLASYGSGGTLVPGSLYYNVGQTINVSYPFTVCLYLNSTLINGLDEVFFNYSVSGAAGDHALNGTYDHVVFNSTQISKKAAEYYVSGNQFAPVGRLPYDVEFVIGGPGGGSTTSLYGIDATMSLKYLSAGSYQNVRAAYDAGSSTGETASGIAVSWNSQDQAILSAGPSFVYGLWNISSAGMQRFSGTIKPETSFLFVSRGAAFSNLSAAWAPLGTGGAYNFSLPSGSYTAGVFSNWHDAEYGSLSSFSGKDMSLTLNISRGIYVPIYIFGNQQLAQVSERGSGTLSSPYLVTGIQNSTILPIFGKFNDYAFPVFSGMLVSGTTAVAQFDGLPSFYIDYSENLSNFLTFYGLPGINYLNLEFYNDSHITLLNSNFVSGWFSSALAGYFPASDVLLWNTTDSLIASNYFSSMDLSLLIYNPPGAISNNTVWGNDFEQNNLVLSTAFGSINTVGSPTGMLVFSSGNTIYNNNFNVYDTAVSPDIDIYTGNPANYSNGWNITRAPLSYYSHFLASNLTGGILSGGPNGIDYQGGNYWWNYLGNGSEIYNNSGLIAAGGDSTPLIHNVFSITFTEFGLPSGATWSIDILTSSIILSGTQNSITFYEPNGTYYLQIYSNGFFANQSSGFVIVSGEGQSFGITFYETYLIKFIESGLPEGTLWSMSLNGVSGSSETTTIEYLATNGTFTYTLGAVPGYLPESGSSTFSVNGGNETVQIAFFAYTFPVLFSESGLPAGTMWGLYISGKGYSTESSSLGLNLPNGTYYYTVTGAGGFSVSEQYGKLLVQNSSATVSIKFTSENYAVTFTQKGMPSGGQWSVTLNGKTFKGTTSYISVTEAAGYYNYTVSGSSGYSASIQSGMIYVNGNISVPVVFSRHAIDLYQVLDYVVLASSVAILSYALYTFRRSRK